MFNIFKKKNNKTEDDFSINSLQKLTVESHIKYVEDKTIYLIDVLKYCIKRTAKDGYYQFSTMTNYEDEFRQFYQAITPIEWDNFLIILKNTFKKLEIETNKNHPYWIDFDWSGKDE